jgi:hypothetical protein
MRGTIPNDYRGLLERSFREARGRVFGDPGELDQAERERASIAAYANRPVEFVHEVLGAVTWRAQRATLRALPKHHNVLNCGSRRTGKSRTSTFAVTQMMATGPTRCIVTATTHQQVRNNLFSWIRKQFAMSKIRLPGRMGVTSWRMDDPTWFAIGLSVDKPDNVQGVHSDVELPEHYKFDDETPPPPPDPQLEEEDLRRAERDPSDVIGEELFEAKRRANKTKLLFVFDELAGMSAEIVETVQGSLIGDLAYALAQFNPTFSEDSGHPAARWLQPGAGWHRIHTCGRAPPPELHKDELFDECFHGPKDGVPHELVPDSWIDARIAEWGPTSAMTMAHVYGIPSNVGVENQFIPWRMLHAQLNPPRVLKDSGRVGDRHIGWDVAGSEGGDWNVAQLWVCGMLVDHDRWRWSDTAASRERVMMLTRKWSVGGQPIPWRNVHIDATGGSMGKAIADEMRARGCRIDAVDFGAAPQNDWELLVGPEMRFVNRKAELLWVLRCALDKGIAAIPAAFGDTIRQAQWYTYKEVARAEGTALKCSEDKDDLRELYQRLA